MFPYLPKDREILYVSPDNKFMKEATKVLAKSGCRKQPTAAVVVKNGVVIGHGANSGKKVDVCPRVVRKCPTGTGYEFCKTVCEQEGHAEIVAIANALLRGNDLRDADMYMEGHWWVCKNCWDKIIEVGIVRVFLRIDSIERYKQ